MAIVPHLLYAATIDYVVATFDHRESKDCRIQYLIVFVERRSDKRADGEAPSVREKGVGIWHHTAQNLIVPGQYLSTRDW